jgi:N-methylhydantoinase A
MVDVTTVGAGGGSIAWVDSGGALRVGPQSAGSQPGPACYGRGGERATVTDANLLLGYINRETRLGGELSLDYAAARRALSELAEKANLESAREAAEGVFEVANANMTRAIRSVTVERGYDPRDFGLVAFGGAGPIHAAALADNLDIGTVVVPHVGGVLSAYGLLDADETYDAVRTHQTPIETTTSEELTTIYDGLVSGLPIDTTDEDVEVRRAADLRYEGQSFELEVETGGHIDTEALRAAFEQTHKRVYGYTADERVEIVNLRATATIPRRVPSTSVATETIERLGEHTALFDGAEHSTPIYQRPMTPERTIRGPAVVEQAESTTVIPPNWEGTVQTNGSLVLTETDQ